MSSSVLLSAYFATAYPNNIPAYNPANVPLSRKLTGPMFAFAQDWRKRLFSYSSETHTSSPKITSDSPHIIQRVLFTTCSCLSRSISRPSPITRPAPSPVITLKPEPNAHVRKNLLSA
ncbi:hypothetical protein E6H35_00800 [Candidatus Bathyarchaeota archaeon]|nr:MAG: hypothetical protein E6H35_00800 [Candidatus Bathyarchaeota archaeon]